MNSMVTQFSAGLVECRERAKVVSISSPESSGSTSSSPDILPIVIIVVLVVVVIALVVVLVLKGRSSKPKGAPGVSTLPLRPSATAPCRSCGAPIPQGAPFCPKCGASQAGGPNQDGGPAA